MTALVSVHAAWVTVSLLAAQPVPPNIVVLLADDYTHDALRCVGKWDIDTPNLDRLAARGTRFTHASNMGSWQPAVCVASRTMLMTGRSLFRAEAIAKPAALQAEVAAGRLWPQQMKAAGYRTAMTGKWHVATDVTKVFDQTQNIRAGMPRDTPAGYNRPPAPPLPDRWHPTDPTQGGYWQGGTHWTEVTANDAVRFVRELAPQPEPYFLYTAFNAPHDPRQAPQEYLDRYPLERVRLPASFQPRYAHADAMGADEKLRDERLALFPRTTHAIRTHRREYFAIITHLDAHIGRILDAIDASSEAANTLIFFSADHGLACGEHGLLGKQNLYDHSLRAPLLMAGPKVPAGRVISTPIAIQDLFPTALAAAQTQKPEYVEFQSLWPLLQEPAATPPTPSHPQLFAYMDRQRAVIDDGWKLIVYPKSRTERLYHLTQDADEQYDLIDRPEHQPKRMQLRTKLQTQMQFYGDTLKLSW
jgi:choline-sulfatase